MHGRVRRVITDEERIKKKKKLEQYYKLRNSVFEKTKSDRISFLFGNFDEEAMQISAGRFTKIADFGSIWSCGRSFRWSQPNRDDRAYQFQQESTCNRECNHGNRESYCVRAHRTWVLGHHSNANFGTHIWDVKQQFSGSKKEPL
ncbi:hypothetical protein Tsp_15277, partial [Trichinella spiralis]|uniref:hypothetical protein n=1 Tax=Trichinella spiralis TaxID=6334 RepID=UPI0001EFE48E